MKKGTQLVLETNGSSIREGPLSLKLAGGRVKSAVAENLAKLKKLLEEGRVVLQDGRQITA